MGSAGRNRRFSTCFCMVFHRFPRHVHAFAKKFHMVFAVRGPGRLEEFFLRLEVDPKAVQVCKHLVDERGTVDTLKLRPA